MKTKLHRKFTLLAFFLNLFVTLISVYLVMQARELFIDLRLGTSYSLFWLPIIPAMFTLLSFYHWAYLGLGKRHDHSTAYALNALLVVASFFLYFTLPKIAYMPAYQMLALAS